MKSWIGRLLANIGALREDPDVQAAEDVAALMDSASEAASAGDYETAVAMWRPLAAGGVARAQSNLGACYADALGVERDLEAAARLFARAAEGGDAVGERNLAALHFTGEGGLAQDDAAAATFYRRAAEQGDAIAQDMLSWMLLEGRGVEADPVESRRWALGAAEGELPASMTRLGFIAQNGLGMESAPEEAARWWYEAARRGDADGQAMLGAALHLGTGVERDDRAALVWLLRADAGGSQLAEPYLELARASLTPEDAQSAERAAKNVRSISRSAAESEA